MVVLMSESNVLRPSSAPSIRLSCCFWGMANQIIALFLFLTVSPDPVLQFRFVFLSHAPPPLHLFVALFRAMPPFFSTVCMLFKCVHVLLAFSSAFAAEVSSVPEALSEIITLNVKHGRTSQSTWTCQQLRLSHLQKQSSTVSVSPLSFLSPDCCRLWPSISRHRRGPTSWHLTEVMG